MCKCEIWIEQKSVSGDKLYEWINNTNCIEIYEFVEGESDLRGKARVGNFEKAYLGNVNLTGAILLNGDFTDANFTGAKLDGTVWKGAKIVGAKFEGSMKK
ncbi:hypothetical protein COE98_24215 [Bacillus wiedmannii]|uniref:Pentapeptide repeat-containing protein n=1 Tax=Bacillus wiedmannii TaxID=1890302 RepID=A0A2B6DT27_9BACI|nr:hypothetical protein CN646_29730 [Bacillus wiedmannii]PEK59267.1 hypothetical protein CN595_19385 [Bacillus wiedmannii]PEL51569.1 hypothetical protein CN622_30180 [Bacillus wiedmannii]PEO10603.1 hypothetical protein CN562_18425 [Bacillus wiedmannii]PEQ03535.1 hypothetical protein CN587_17555 [Bacillus wiedmannii]